MGENSTSAEDSKGKAPLPHKSTTNSSKMNWVDEVTDALSQSNSNFAMQNCSDFMELDGGMSRAPCLRTMSTTDNPLQFSQSTRLNHHRQTSRVRHRRD